jgi:hypothetical protein
MPENPKNAVRTLEETTAVAMPPETVLRPGAVSLKGTELSVKNQELANLIESKLASASRLTEERGAAATDADVSVSVKVRF